MNSLNESELLASRARRDLELAQRDAGVLDAVVGDIGIEQRGGAADPLALDPVGQLLEDRAVEAEAAAADLGAVVVVVAALALVECGVIDIEDAARLEGEVAVGRGELRHDRPRRLGLWLGRGGRRRRRWCRLGDGGGHLCRDRRDRGLLLIDLSVERRILRLQRIDLGFERVEARQDRGVGDGRGTRGCRQSGGDDGERSAAEKRETHGISPFIS